MTEIIPVSEPYKYEDELKERYDFYLKDFDLNPEDLKDRKILEVGSSNRPEFVEYCLRKGITKDIYAVDIKPYNRHHDPDFPKLEEKKFFDTAEAKSHFIQGDILNLPIKVEKFDLVLMHAVPVVDEAEKLISQIIDKLPEGGEFRISPIFRDGPHIEAIEKMASMLISKDIIIEKRIVGFVESENEAKEKYYRNVVIFRKIRQTA